MHFVPRSLLWRTFFLIALVIVASMSVWFLVFERMEREPRAQQLGQMLVSIVNLTRTALINADPLLRIALLRDLSEQEGIRVYPAEPGDKIEPIADTRMFQIVEAQLKHHLGPQTRLAGKREGVNGIWVSFQIDPEDPEDQFWVMLPRDRFQRVRTLEWIGWTAAAGLLALLAAFFIVSRMARPLASLANAARQVGRGELPPPLTESGPEEFAGVSRAFNQMSVNLAQLESDRALVLAGVSHDLRTPLARLRLGIELSGAPAEDVDAMSADIDEMDRILGQFLDFARGSTEESFSEIDTTTLLEELAGSYQRRNFPVSTQEKLPNFKLSARPQALRRALSNLIDNALRYAGREQAIELGAHRANGFIHMLVLDRGPGIPADQVARLKRPFTRLEEARTDAHGSGLGLAIVERIARAHGGRLELKPREGGGLSAEIVLPAQQTGSK